MALKSLRGELTCKLGGFERYAIVDEMLKKRYEIKQNQHHVWAHLLRQWSVDGQNVWHTSIKGRVSHHSVRDICREDFFYKSSYLTAEHVELIAGFSRKSDADLQAMHATYLEDFLRLQALEEVYRNSGLKGEELENIFQASKCNIIENYHCADEREVVPILARLLEFDLSPFEVDENLMSLLSFLGHQIIRTKAAKERVLQRVLRGGLPTVETDKFAQVLNECWFFVSYMFGMNIGRSLFFSRNSRNFCLLDNRGSEPFITSDTPVINLCDARAEGNESEVVGFDLYCALSPTVALVVSSLDAYPPDTLVVADDKVGELNLKVARNASTHIIGDGESIVRKYKKEVGKV